MIEDNEQAPSDRGEALELELAEALDENRRLRALIRELKAEANVALREADRAFAVRDQAAVSAQEAWIQLGLIRGSQSWKLTAPLRVSKQFLRF